VVFCCRWVDFCALTATLTLLLAHIDSHTNSAGDQMRHRRLPDRALVETAMDTMDELNRVNGDLLTKQTTEVARKWLDIESDASQVNSIYTSRIVVDKDHDESPNVRTLRLDIPYFGTVVTSNEGRLPQQPLSTAEPPSLSDNSSTPSTSFTAPNIMPSAAEYFSSLDSLGSTRTNTWQSIMEQARTGQAQTQGFSAPLVSLQEDFESQKIVTTDFIAGENQWSFQGVDATFFDAVVRSNTANPGNWDQSWVYWDTMCRVVVEEALKLFTSAWVKEEFHKLKVREFSRHRKQF